MPNHDKPASAHLNELEAAARHARERHRLYRAKAYGPSPTSAGRLRELERQSKLADSQLERAQAEANRPGRAR
jgi:hypothetical protein